MQEAFAAAANAIVAVVGFGAVAPLWGAEEATEGDPFLPRRFVLRCGGARNGEVRGRVDVTYQRGEHAGVVRTQPEPRAVMSESVDERGLAGGSRDPRDDVRWGRRWWIAGPFEPGVCVWRWRWRRATVR